MGETLEGHRGGASGVPTFRLQSNPFALQYLRQTGASRAPADFRPILARLIAARPPSQLDHALRVCDDRARVSCAPVYRWRAAQMGRSSRSDVQGPAGAGSFLPAIVGRGIARFPAPPAATQAGSPETPG